MSARDLARAIQPLLEVAGIPDARIESELLVRYTGELSRSHYFAGGDFPESHRPKLFAAIERRVAREPLAYITGRRAFMGLEFQVTPAVLIPRPETELLVEEAVRRSPAGALVCDVGTGSGCIAVSIAQLRPDVAVLATDISEDALAVARGNAERHGAGVAFVRSSLLSVIRCPVDRELVVVANLPYIATNDIARLEPEVRNAEPRIALDGGPGGLDLLGELIHDCAERLRPRLLLLEVAAGQAQQVAELLTKSRAEVEIKPDLAGIGRVVVAEWR